MANKIVMLRIVGGEFLIGSLDTSTVIDSNGNGIDTSNKICLKETRVFNIQMTQRGMAIAFIPPFPFTKNQTSALECVEIDKSIVVLRVDEDQIDPEIVNSYKSNISGLDLSAANKGIII